MNDELDTIYEKNNIYSCSRKYESRVPSTSLKEIFSPPKTKVYDEFYNWDTEQIWCPNTLVSDTKIKKSESLSSTSLERFKVLNLSPSKKSLTSHMAPNCFTVQDLSLSFYNKTLHTALDTSSQIPTGTCISQTPIDSHGTSYTSKIPYFNDPEEQRSAKFPSKAGPNDWVRLPRQRQVDPDEYEEFLNLGLGGIFDLDLNRILYEDRKWLDPKNDISDFFNYGHTIETWQFVCDRVKSLRNELQYSLPIKRYYKGHGNRSKEIENGRIVYTRNHSIWTPILSERLNERTPDLSVQLILSAKESGSKIRKIYTADKSQYISKLKLLREYSNHNPFPYHKREKIAYC